MDKYHVLELIGEGQFGKVYKGRRKFGSQMVALKFIGKKGKSEKELAALRSEMHILEGLTDCAYIIRMLDWFETASELCVVTEYAQGELFEILEDDTSLPEERVREVAIQLVAALRYLHAHRIIHRDMKPQNILIGASGTLKVCDFGFARSMSANTSLLTSVKGTPLYMAPELVRSMPYNHTTDLWSLGVILYELAVGQPPFFTTSFYTLVHLIVDTPVSYPPTMSAEFKSFLQGLLHKSPSKRLTWPQLQEHPFVRETEEQERERVEKAERGMRSDRHMTQGSEEGEEGDATSSGAPSARSTPRTQHPMHKGLGGAALPPKPATAAAAHHAPHHAASAARAVTAAPPQSQSQSASRSRRGSCTAVTSSHSVAPAKPSTAAASTGGNHHGSHGMDDGASNGAGSRSRAASAELDLRDLPRLLSPAAAASIPHTLQQLTHMLHRAAASPQLPSPLLDVYPTLLAEQVPLQLCRLLVSAHRGALAPTLDYQSLLPAVLQALVAMVQPTGGVVAPMPLYTCDAPTDGGGSTAPNGAGGAAAARSLRAAAGRTPPNLELQLRRQLAECVCQAVEGQISAFELLAQTTRAACKETAAALNRRGGDPTTTLSSLVIVLFQCTRSCVANSASAGSGPSANVASGGLLDCLARDVPLLSALLGTLQSCASGIPAAESEVTPSSSFSSASSPSFPPASPRALLAGRLLLFFANLCGKHPGVVRTLVSQCGLDGSTVVGYLERGNSACVALPASFLLSQLITNPHAKLDSFVSNPMPLLQLAASWLATPAPVAFSALPASSSTAAASFDSAAASSPPPSLPCTLLVQLEGSGVGYSLLGSHDGLLQLLQALLYFHAMQHSQSVAAAQAHAATPPRIIAPEAAHASERFLTGDIWALLLARLEKLDAHPSPSQMAEEDTPASLATHAAAQGELSVLGWTSLLSILLDLLKMHARILAARIQRSKAAGVAGASNDAEHLLSDSLFQGMCALLSPARISSLYSWPEACGGGSVGVASLLKRSLGLLYVPFSFRSIPESTLARCQKVLFNRGFVRRILSALRTLELPGQWEAPMGFLAHLTMRNENFEKQFMEQGGLALMATKQMLNPAPRGAMVPAPHGTALPGGPATGLNAGAPALMRVSVTPSAQLLTDSLNIVSHLARSSAANYPPIHAANFYAEFQQLLGHADAAVRGKVCNVLGNLCRHSNFFYPHLASADLIRPLVARCADADPGVRKWAAFALGNAVFYDASLCNMVSAAIPALMQLLRPAPEDGAGAASSDSGASDRTAQNAAGVLTNMLRHGVAAQEMIEQGAVGTLLALMEEAGAGAGQDGTQAPSALQVQCARSALFTLGDLAAFRAARRQLAASGALERIQRVQQASNDPKLLTYYQRLLTRYQGPAQG